MLAQRRILVIEDERDLAEMLVFNLRKAGFQASAAADGPTGVQAAITSAPDLIILDVMLPGLSGNEVARQVRTHPRTAKVPIMMLTARTTEADQVSGLSVGADDYVAKPFSMKVVLARVEALLRRCQPESAGPSASRIELDPGHGAPAIVADLANHTITVGGTEVPFTLTEFKLLVALLKAPKRVLSRDELIGRVMGLGVVVTTRTIDVHVAALRKKLGGSGALIRTVRGVGYQMLTQMPAPSVGADSEVGA